ncbi:MAG: hypothetical protein LBF86_05310 [Helicobacteraceae bacterium]|jgi:hypothetical protein|nr:hypothetical protein [Helicobacteraceae bacterium]
MAGQTLEFADFRPFLRHEIGELSRIREEQRKFTVMFLQYHDADRMFKALRDTLRTADVIFRKNDVFFVVMPATDKEGAMHVARTLEEHFGHAIADVNATWPEDGLSEGELLGNFSQYIRAKCDLDLMGILR